MLHEDGWVMPRLETPRPDDVVGSMGEEAADWIDAETVVGGPLMGWQRHVLDRALEVRADGSLRWPVVVVSVPQHFTHRPHHGAARFRGGSCARG